MTTPPRRPFVIQALAGLLTFYAMAGVWLAMTMGSNRDPRFHWIPLVIGGLAFAVSAGLAALAVLRLERRGPTMLMVCALIGATLCIAMPAAVRDTVITRDMWLAAIAGGLLFAAFLLLAARFIRLYLRSIG
jgi:hypothetical protein